jgi:hypothetical protein
MLGPIAALVLLATQPQGSMLQQIFPQRTGQNGYEELVMAADQAANLRLRVYHQHGSGEPGDDPVSRRLAPMSRLQVRREEMRVAEPVYALVRRGLTKPTHRPFKATGVTMFPELAWFRTISQSLTSAAYVHMADGRPGAAAESLLLAFRLNEAVAPASTISGLTATAATRILAYSFIEHSRRWSAADLDRFSGWATDVLSRPSPFAHAAVREIEGARPEMSGMLRDMFQELDGAPVDTNRPAWLNLLVRMPREQRPAFIEQAIAYFENVQRRQAARFELPERQWLVPESRDEIKEEEIQTTGDVIRYLVDEFISIDVMPVPLIDRMQLRLFRLHAQVERFRWEHGRLPHRLEELPQQEWAIDPLRDEPFGYDLLSADTFRVYSKGLPETGEITLTGWERRGEDPQPPPP